MGQIAIAGFSSTPIHPFVDPATGENIGVEADAPGLQLNVSKLAPGQADRWVAGAIFGQPDDAPANAPRVAGGAIAWKDDAGDYHSQAWDSSPLSEDPRTAKQPWGAFRPNWVGDGTFIGREIFAKESNVTIGTPTGSSSVQVDLPPGILLVPQEIPGLSRYDFTNGIPRRLRPQAPSFSGVTTARDPYKYSGTDFWVATNQAWVNEGNLDDPYDEPDEYPFHILGYYDTNTILFDVFHPGLTVNEVLANNSRPKAEPLTRPPEIGDQLATSWAHGYFYQHATPRFFTDADGSVDPIPAGTWEWWIFRVPATGEKTVEAVTENPTQNYGIRIEGTEGTSSDRQGTVHQLAWHFGQPIRADGTWQQTITEERDGSISRPPNTSGPLGGDGDSPGGIGFPNGWPSAADAAGADAGFWITRTLTKPGFNYYRPVTRNVRIEWEEWGVSADAPWKTSEEVVVPAEEETITYDGRGAITPGWQSLDGPVFRAEVYRGSSNWSGRPAKDDALFGPGYFIADYLLVGPEDKCWVTERSNPGYYGWVAGPQHGECQVWVKWVHGTPEIREFLYRYRARTGTPLSDPPNPTDFPDEPTSGVPGGGSPGSDPPNFGLPPGSFPDGDWNTVLTQETEYQIDAAVGPTLRSPQTFREAFVTTTPHSADWNGSRSNSSISSGAEVGTYELEGRFVFPMVARSPQNSSLTTEEEALYIVRTLDRRVQSTPFTTPYPYDSQKVYYEKAGSPPVEITGDIEALFPEVAWQDPDQYLWSRNASLQDGVLYLYPPPSEGKDYRRQNTTIQLQAFQVDDGSLTELAGVSKRVRSGDSAGAIVHDISAVC